jgi:hypothetical protein
MSSIRRLSREQASERAGAIARRLVETTDLKGWDCELGSASPDPISTDRIGKTPRFWVCVVDYTKGDSILDDPGMIKIDLQLETACWVEGP